MYSVSLLGHTAVAKISRTCRAVTLLSEKCVTLHNSTRHEHTVYVPVEKAKIPLPSDFKYDSPLTLIQARAVAESFCIEDRHLLLHEFQRLHGDKALEKFSNKLAHTRWRRKFSQRSASVVGVVDPTGRFCEIPSLWLSLHKATRIKSPTFSQLLHNALFCGTPFIGFGFLDNVIMITAGEYIETSVGVALGIGTMTAAALGNAVSDVAGVGSAYYVETLAHKVGLKPSSLTPQQQNLKQAHWSANIGRAIGVALGCIIGMFPLFFLPDRNADDVGKGNCAAIESNVTPDAVNVAK